ncbi:MAG: DNA-binding response regulator [Lachnospiraceae bacterium]|jgi:hypothetical protein|nr:MAG: DNA-binding response regulator [Lachnospiraceae bacterium]
MASIMILETSAFSMKLLEYEFYKVRKKHKILYKLSSLKNIEEKPELSKVDIILIDACLEDNNCGIDIAIRIKKRFPGIKIVIMSSVPECSFLKKAKSCGCDGFWYKEDEETDIVSIVDRVMLGEKVFIGYKKPINIGEASLNELTEAELVILRSFARGYTYAEVAKDCHVSENTVRYHVKNLTSKTGLHNMASIALEAVGKRVILPWI